MRRIFSLFFFFFFFVVRRMGVGWHLLRKAFASVPCSYLQCGDLSCLVVYRPSRCNGIPMDLMQDEGGGGVGLPCERDILHPSLRSCLLPTPLLLLLHSLTYHRGGRGRHPLGYARCSLFVFFWNPIIIISFFCCGGGPFLPTRMEFAFPVLLFATGRVRRERGARHRRGCKRVPRGGGWERKPHLFAWMGSKQGTQCICPRLIPPPPHTRRRGG